jgi:hypothetical protein
MPARALAAIVRQRFSEGGAEAADEACVMIERLHGRQKLEEALLELELMLDAEIDAPAWVRRRRQ